MVEAKPPFFESIRNSDLQPVASSEYTLPSNIGGSRR